MNEVTQIIERLAEDPHAEQELLPLVYDELRKLAAAKLASERADHTLQPTALVHEAYMRLVGKERSIRWENRGHFFAAAAEAMRRVLINHARTRNAVKRGGGDWSRVTLDAIVSPGQVGPDELYTISEMLEELDRQDSRAAEIAKMRIFAGFTVPEIANVLGMGRRSVDRQWSFARAWLRTQLSDREGS